jgi:hypothetical protein
MTPRARIDATSRRRSAGGRSDGRFDSMSILRCRLLVTYAVRDRRAEIGREPEGDPLRPRSVRTSVAACPEGAIVAGLRPRAGAGVTCPLQSNALGAAIMYSGSTQTLVSHREERHVPGSSDRRSRHRGVCGRLAGWLSDAGAQRPA